MRILTDVADAAVLLPCAAAIVALLFLLGWRRAALAWLISACGVWGAIIIGKAMLGACSAWADAVGVRSPSGHTAAAALLGGGVAMMAAWPPGPAGTTFVARRLAWPLFVAACAALAIGSSRVALGLHDVAEVIAGAVVGLSGTAVLVILAGLPPANVSPRAVMVLAAAVALPFYGRHVGAEQTIRWALQAGIWPLSLCRIG